MLEITPPTHGAFDMQNAGMDRGPVPSGLPHRQSGSESNWTGIARIGSSGVVPGTTPGRGCVRYAPPHPGYRNYYIGFGVVSKAVS